MALPNVLEVEDTDRESTYHSRETDAITLKRPVMPRRTDQSIQPWPVNSVSPVPPLSYYEQLTAWLDVKTGGRGEEAQRILSFLVIGGTASVLNLVCLWLFTLVLQHVFPVWILIAMATEISLIYNFWLNDRFTFRTLVDARRTWAQRCLRFHGPASIGFALTLLISSWGHYIGHLTPVTAQAIAIIIVTCVNFVMHRYWTFRPQPTEIALKETAA